MDERLPLRIGGGFVIDSNLNPVQFTEKQARKRAEKAFDPALKVCGFVVFFGRTDPKKLGIDKPACWSANYGKVT